jgi:hypothetical protein
MVSAQQVDDVLRQALNVSDVRDPTQVAAALLRRYGDAAKRMQQETEGLSISGIAGGGLGEVGAATSLGRAGESPGARELQRVTTNLQTDFERVVTHPGNRDFEPEVVGWRDTLLDELSQTVATAQFAQDPLKRDRTFLGIRRMSEYARLARLVGVMNLPLNCDYRRLATTLDDSCNALRILMGEALYEAGLGDGGQILPVPVSDMRARRDALLTATRRLSGQTLGEDDWGDGLNSFQRLITRMDDVSGSPELNIYLREEMLAPVLDRLVGYASRTDPTALRQLASTSMVELVQMRKLLVVAKTVLAEAPSSALSAYVQSLVAFLDVFKDRRAGARLVDLAVPLAMAARLTAEDFDAVPRRILRELVSWRAEFAQEVECYLSCCACDKDNLKRQVQLDKILYDIDKSIDLMAQGDGGNGTPWGLAELRASAYAPIIGNFLAAWKAAAGKPEDQGGLDEEDDPQAELGTPAAPGAIMVDLAEIVGVLELPLKDIVNSHVWTQSQADKLLAQVVKQQLREERDWGALVTVLAPRCSGRFDLLRAGAELADPDGAYSFDTPEIEDTIAVPFPETRVSEARIVDALENFTNGNKKKKKKGGGYGAGGPNIGAIGEPLEDIDDDFDVASAKTAAKHINLALAKGLHLAEFRDIMRHAKVVDPLTRLAKHKGTPLPVAENIGRTLGAIASNEVTPEMAADTSTLIIENIR